MTAAARTPPSRERSAQLQGIALEGDAERLDATAEDVLVGADAGRAEVLGHEQLGGEPAVPQGGDKLEHFAAYGVLAGAAVQLFATRRALLCAGVGLLGLGVAMEIVQGACTTTRQMDALDALANALGVLAGMASARTPWRDALLRAGRRA